MARAEAYVQERVAAVPEGSSALDRLRAAIEGHGLDLSVLRMLILGALNWAIEWYRPGMLSASEVARHATTMICEGITARR